MSMTIEQAREIRDYADEKIEKRNYFREFTDNQIAEQFDYESMKQEIDDLAAEDTKNID